MSDYDSPWKEALEHYLPECLALLAPWLHQAIDWTCAPVFLDKELQAIAPHSATSRRYADKLVRLRSKTQRVFWLLLHIEVQGGAMSGAAVNAFSVRMYHYYTRISDHHRQSNARTHHPGKSVEVISLAILTESQGDAARLIYEHSDPLGATHVQFGFPVIHLKSWLERWEALLEHAKTNPFAVVLMAQLKAQQIPPGDLQRVTTKSNIVRLLYQYNYARKDAQQVLRLIDWMISLPEEHVPVFIDNVVAIEQEYRMTYITSFERYAEQRGLNKGLLEGKAEGITQGVAKGKAEGQAAVLQRQLLHKFGSLSKVQQQRLLSATSAQLETWSLNILDAETLDDVFTN